MPKQLNDYSDERLRVACFHCNRITPSWRSNKEHIPSKSLLAQPYPSDLNVIRVCETCNENYSLDEEYFAAFISVVLSGSSEPSDQVLSVGTRILSRNKKLRERITQSRVDDDSTGNPTWYPEVERVKNVIVKNALGHAYFECGEPQYERPSHVEIFPLQSLSDQQLSLFLGVGTDFDVWPEVGSRWMQRLIQEDAFDHNGFYVLQPNVYRFKFELSGGLAVKTIIHEYLGTLVAWT